MQDVWSSTTECRQGQKRVWVRKAPQPVTVPIQTTAHGDNVVSPIVDQEGFQRSLRPIRVRVGLETPVITSNAFQVLEAPLIDNEGLVGGQCQGDEQRIVMGLNSVQKQNEVKHFIQKYAVGLVGLLEHKVKISNIGKLYQNVFANWCFTRNSSYHSGGRIVVGWKAGRFTVNIAAASSQFVHFHVTPVSGRQAFCTFVYAFNDAGMRKDLWRDLLLLNTQDPWIVCGDLNCVMALDNRIGAPVRHSDIVDVSNCMHACGMEDIKCVGNLFTWNNKQQGNNRVFSKIDRFMANHAWQSCFLVAEVCFMPEGHFDHSPGLFSVYPRDDGGKKPFKYFTMWKSSTVFSDTVKQAWNTQIIGTKMFILINKLKRVKQALKELNKVGFIDIHGADLRAYQNMVNAQSAMHNNLTDQGVADAELTAIQEYKEKHKAYLAFLSQKAKLSWLKDGDENTSFFPQSIKTRKMQNQVYSIYDMKGEWKDTADGVSQAFLEYYKLKCY
ncbi:uncharacterized protein [Spinacia oleracea]|uniref:Endonuclease/exonuclease/phosphatase domain-containing protein n=1 Tax=Spinacia oleracea TaxID=3562 RepID=A0ABM3R3U9_SPIOL|nr:uncharacterized protein LOC110793172 [Spinacia oleracea]